MKRQLDKTKKSNKKCEHCTYYNKVIHCCQRINKVNLSIPYWKKCQFFKWIEDSEGIDAESSNGRKPAFEVGGEGSSPSSATKHPEG